MTPEEKKQYRHDYYMSHREEHKVRVQAWRTANADKFRAWQKSYYAEHREEILARQKRRYQESK